MNILIVYAHPEARSFNAALKDRACAVLSELGHEVVVSDLYAQDWMPASGRRNFTTVANAEVYAQQVEEKHAAANRGFADDVAGEIEKLLRCDLLLLQFPMWWGGMPAAMKGWIDRVFARGVAYDFEQLFDNGPMRGKAAMLSVSTGGGASMYSPDGIGGDINTILTPIHHNTLRFCGFEVLPPFISWQSGGGSDRDRTATLEAYEERLKKVTKERSA